MKRYAIISTSILSSAVAMIFASAQSGCATEAFCFENCDDGNANAGSGGGVGAPDAGTSGTGGLYIEGGLTVPEAGDVIETCKQTNGGSEICDGLDNDCNGTVDDGFDLHDPRRCGTCSYNCFTEMINADPTTITCDWDGTPGKQGTCGFGACTQDWYNVDQDPANGCEYPCVKNGNDDTLCNNRDDDCDGLRDEDVGLCASVKDCGRCGGACVVLHGTPTCDHFAAGPCDSTNTRCAIEACDDDDHDGLQDWWDLDNSYATGCEYRCEQTNGGIEICGDGVDNDCDGRLDGGDDDLSGDPQLGKPCFGDPDGVCALPAHAGTTACVGQAVTCVGADVVVPGQLAEVCNNVDDDCNGIVDDHLTDVGKTCGTSNVFPCTLGTEQCVNGALTCVGAVNPGQEFCNGLDDDCDGEIDDTPLDATGACGPTDQGACEFGNKVCQGGVVLCVGQVSATTEVCNGIDDDCDGQADNNSSDVGGTCGQSNTAPCQFGTWTCQNGARECTGEVDPGTETCNGVDDDCDGVVDDAVPGAGATCGQSNTFPCRFGAMQCVGGQMTCVGAVDPTAELCNGADDNCNGAIDDSPTDQGGACGQDNSAPCKFGTLTCQNGSLVCSGNIDPVPETCDGKDNDCDGQTDENPSGVGAACGQSNTAPCKYGTTTCVGGAVVCTGAVNPSSETCDSIDNDCDGVVDDAAVGTGQSCGQSNVFPCSFGTTQCQGGAITCVGAVNPGTETCNGRDDDCDGTIDDSPSGATGACNVPPAPPPGATSPCVAGTRACVGGAVVCQGSIGPTSPTDTCGVDANCDGQLTNQPNTSTDVYNCGACGNNCLAGAVHSLWSCNGTCQFQGCQPGYYDLNGDRQCEYACTFIQAQEACNGVDDNCNGQIDEGVVAPSPIQVCGVSPSASGIAECTTGVNVACVSSAWACTFPAGVCPGGCSANDEVCDTLDNDCDGVRNENVANYGQPCASDDASPGSQGACRRTGTFVCSGPNATTCSVTPATCASLPGGCTELCDGIDNDCDGSTDETFNAKGSNTTYFVRPAVTRLANNLWIYTYEASRPNATDITAGSGNGYWTSAPSGIPMNMTRACSVSTKVPWFNVTPTEVTQTCQQMGGTICSRTDWVAACQATALCTFGYNPRGAACTSGYTGTKFCNLGPSFDINSTLAGIQNGLLPTASNRLQNCWADWAGLQSNSGTAATLRDITGNLREIVLESGTTYKLMGGAFDTASESGAACGFTFYTVNNTFKFFDAGFRCCFTSNPS